MPSQGEAVTLRTDLRPGDIGWIIHRHGVLYAQEYGFDHTFEAYVAGPLAELVRSPSLRDRIWIAERDGRIAGCIAIVAADPQTAHLGPYNRLGEAHAAIRKWCADHGHALTGVSWEIYGHWTDDPAQLRTDVFYLLRPVDESAG
jgi:hypothetical protein